MIISRTGGVIAAASKKIANPLLQIGSIPIIKRIVLTYQQAGIFPIVIVTGTEEQEVRSQLARYDVIFLHNEDFECPQLFDSVKIGLSYLQGKCERIVFSPVNVPMFSPETLKQLMDKKGEIVTPMHQKTGGHPVVLSSGVLPGILGYCGENGLRGAIESMEDRRVWVEVNDAGILSSIHDDDQLRARLEEHNRALLHPFVNISLAKEADFFNSRIKLLLFLIMDTNSVNRACEQMALSLGKAWEMINNLEKELGYAIVVRRHGGSHGGRTMLTEQGLAFLEAYQQFEDNIFQYTQNEFIRLFRSKNII